MSPFYVVVDPNARAMLALIEAVEAAFGVPTPKSQLQEVAARLDAATIAAVSGNEQFATMVRSLEEQFDWIRRTTSAGVPIGEPALGTPDTKQLVADLEHFLREQRPHRDYRKGGGDSNVAPDQPRDPENAKGDQP